MTKNLVHIIYPDEYSCCFIMYNDMSTHDILERVFAEWNHGSGVECELFVYSGMRSLSVNDIVCVNGKYFQCASFGWNEVSPEYVNELEKAVATHPRRWDGAWFALNEVMWEKNKKRSLVVA